jgi:cytochrome P450 family 6
VLTIADIAIILLSLETLRMAPPLAQLVRQTTRDYEVSGSNITIPKGSQVLIPVYAIHMDPKNFPKPEKFDPERFNEENKKDRHSMAYLPFGEFL